MSKVIELVKSDNEYSAKYMSISRTRSPVTGEVMSNGKMLHMCLVEEDRYVPSKKPWVTYVTYQKGQLDLIQLGIFKEIRIYKSPVEEGVFFCSDLSSGNILSFRYTDKGIRIGTSNNILCRSEYYLLAFILLVYSIMR